MEKMNQDTLESREHFSTDLLASGPRIKKYFAMEVKDAHVVSEPPQVTRLIQKDIFPTVKIYKKGGIHM
ncbi:hypothetical protein BGZ88_007967 [Linnemannia elongata]|nr:hypothetical protein BGZ88_007967 [Linnemannia elongata]